MSDLILSKPKFQKLRTVTKWISWFYLISLPLSSLWQVLGYAFMLGEPSQTEILINKILNVNHNLVFPILALLLGVFGLIDFFNKPRSVFTILLTILNYIVILSFIL